MPLTLQISKINMEYQVNTFEFCFASYPVSMRKECRTAESSAVAFKKYFIQFLTATWYCVLNSLFLSVFLLIFCLFSDTKFDNTLFTFTWMYRRFCFHLNFCPNLPNIYFLTLSYLLMDFIFPFPVSSLYFSFQFSCFLMYYFLVSELNNLITYYLF